MAAPHTANVDSDDDDFAIPGAFVQPRVPAKVAQSTPEIVLAPPALRDPSIPEPPTKTVNFLPRTFRVRNDS
jgi:hypothetical protein